MNSEPLPQAAIRTAFENAARAHDAARLPGAATRQISAPSQGSTVEQAIANAAQQTTVDFDFLVAQAQVESAMNPDARARTSSATGLYQFIDSTWLGTMHRHGERFGLGDVAAQINVTQSGQAYVNDPSTREAILAMRSDPEIAALMAAGLAEDNRAHLAPILGRQPDHGELYLAHFLGAGGAGRFLSAMNDNPNQSAAALFRAPAAANRAIFYDRSGSPRSLAGVMDNLSGKLERARAIAPVSMTQGYSAASLTSPGSTSTGFNRAGLDRANFASSSSFRTEDASLGRSRSAFRNAASLTLANPASRGSMSGVLRSTFGENPQLGSTTSTQQVRRAYDQLKALGL